MLDSLVKMKPDDALEALSSAALALSPNPGEEDKLPPDIVSALIEELRLRLKLGPADLSPRAKSQLQDALTTLIDEMVLSGQDENTIKARLAKHRSLPFGGYVVDVSFSSREMARSVRRAAIDQCLSDPDLIEDLVNVPEAFRRPEQYTSWLAAKWNTPRTGKPYWLILAIYRNDYHLRVINAVKIDPDQVDLDGAETLVDWLEKFADVYGIPFNEPGVGSTKFLRDHETLYEEMQVRGNRILDTVPNGSVVMEMSAYDDAKTGRFIFYTFILNKRIYLSRTNKLH